MRQRITNHKKSGADRKPPLPPNVVRVLVIVGANTSIPSGSSLGGNLENPPVRITAYSTALIRYETRRPRADRRGHDTPGSRQAFPGSHIPVFWHSTWAR